MCREWIGILNNATGANRNVKNENRRVNGDRNLPHFNIEYFGLLIGRYGPV